MLASIKFFYERYTTDGANERKHTEYTIKFMFKSTLGRVKQYTVMMIINIFAVYSLPPNNSAMKLVRYYTHHQGDSWCV